MASLKTELLNCDIRTTSPHTLSQELFKEEGPET